MTRDGAAAGGPGATPSVRPDQVVDDGLQGERTALAWERTCLSVVLVGALLVRAGALGAGVGRWAGVVLLGLAGVGLLLTRTRYLVRDQALRGAGSLPGHPLLAAAGIVAVLASLAALATVVALALGPGTLLV